MSEFSGLTNVKEINFTQERVYLVECEELQVYGEGRTPDEALQAAKDAIIATYKDLIENEASLGNGLSELLDVYRSYGIELKEHEFFRCNIKMI